jgi:protein farnesyltransferase subunit beta
MQFEGGFQGRTNKLVDCCYSFWQGAMFPILHSVLANEDPKFDTKKTKCLFDRRMLIDFDLNLILVFKF